jgi:hypothetical protein
MGFINTRIRTFILIASALGLSACSGVVSSPSGKTSSASEAPAASQAAPASQSPAASQGSAASQASAAIEIATTSLPTGFLSQSYLSTLNATGGIPPYHWNIAAGQLPGGLTLDALSGRIAGTPNQSGTFNISFQLGDSASSVQTKAFNLSVTSTTLDSYGGTEQFVCPNGAATHFYTQQIGSRWLLCTPTGNVFWLRSVYHADASDNVPDYQFILEDGNACATSSPASPSNPCSAIIQKYGDANVTWGPQTVRRLQSWGFNATAEYSSAYVQPTTTNSSWKTPDQSNPQKMPFTGLVWPGHYARNANAYAQPVKDIVGGTNPSVFAGYRSPSPDVFDPNFSIWLQKDLADPGNAEYNWIRSVHSDYLVGLNVDDLDELNGFGAGADFPTLTNGYPDSGIGRWHPHLGWIVLVTAPTQSSGTDANGNPISYSDTTVYSKLALSNWLATRYNGNIAALNQAWGSTYSVFGSAGGWGTGSGVLDENGTHSWVPRDPYRLSGGTPAMQADLDAFLLYHAQRYFSEIKSTLQAAAPGVLYLGPTSLGTWGTPARRQILQAAAQSVDVIVLPSIPTQCIACTDDQQRVDFVAQYGGNKPWMNWEGFFAQPDSYMSVYAAPDTSIPQSSTQGMRGQLFTSMVSGLLNSTDSSTGTYHFVGYKWWELYDNRGEQANWGLLTRRDNPYDGVGAVVATGVDAWGFATGGEQANYGNFLGGVTAANLSVYGTLVGLP